jgi:hypothetical protein
MTLHELGKKAAEGCVFVVGEVRAAKAESSGYVDRKTGKEVKTVVRKYFVEKKGSSGLDIVKITGRVAAEITDPAQVVLGVEKGRIYAFAVEQMERKHGAAFIQARIGTSEPEALDIDAGASAAP